MMAKSGETPAVRGAVQELRETGKEGVFVGRRRFMTI
jgi:hypothetical protein